MGQESAHRLWEIVQRQHGVVARRQLVALGYNSDAIHHRVRSGRLHRIWRGVYAVGRPELTRNGRFMAAVLASGDGAVLSHASAAELWEIRPRRKGQIEVTVPKSSSVRRRGIVAHRRHLEGADFDRQAGIPVTSPVCTLIDIAPGLSDNQLEAAINDADTLGLVDPDALRTAADARRCPRLRKILDRRTFALTDSELERRFLRLARQAGLPKPETGRRLNGYKVDFYWPDLGLVVETDGLRYHRTTAQQTKDRKRDQAHTAAGLTAPRFTHAQVAHEPGYVQSTLTTTAALRPPRSRPRPPA